MPKSMDDMIRVAEVAGHVQHARSPVGLMPQRRHLKIARDVPLGVGASSTRSPRLSP